MANGPEKGGSGKGRPPCWGMRRDRWGDSAWWQVGVLRHGWPRLCHRLSRRPAGTAGLTSWSSDARRGAQQRRPLSAEGCRPRVLPGAPKARGFDLSRSIGRGGSGYGGQGEWQGEKKGKIGEEKLPSALGPRGAEGFLLQRGLSFSAHKSRCLWAEKGGCGARPEQAPESSRLAARHGSRGAGPGWTLRGRK